MQTHILINTVELLKALHSSALPEEEKTKFEGLLKTMTEEEKVELEVLIKESNQSKKEFEWERKKQLAEINLQTGEKLKRMECEEIKNINQEFEKFDQIQNEKELETVAQNIQNNEISSENQNLNKAENHVKKSENISHKGKNFILILLGLMIVAGALIYGLLTL